MYRKIQRNSCLAERNLLQILPIFHEWGNHRWNRLTAIGNLASMFLVISCLNLPTFASNRNFYRGRIYRWWDDGVQKDISIGSVFYIWQDSYDWDDQISNIWLNSIGPFARKRLHKVYNIVLWQHLLHKHRRASRRKWNRLGCSKFNSPFRCD